MSDQHDAPSTEADQNLGQAADVPLVDRFGRHHLRLRVSVTDRCNLRCTYCMPATGAEFVPQKTLLTFEEIADLVEMLVRRCGIHGVRLTGGEPLVRRQLHRLVDKLAGIPGLRDLSLTTNGILLPQQAAELWRSGLRRVNISIDSVNPDAFKQITRRDQLDATLEGIRHAIKTGFKVKLNALAIAGVTEKEAVGLVRFAMERKTTLRFIEFMPLDADGRWDRGAVLSGDRLLEILSDEFGTTRATGRSDVASPAEDFELADGTTIGIIRSVTRPFCGACDRLRLTADGAIRNCLFSTTETPLRSLIRGHATEDEILAAIAGSVLEKKEQHGGQGDGFATATRPMYSIGG